MMISCISSVNERCSRIFEYFIDMAKYTFVVRKLYYTTLEISIGKYSHDVAKIYLTIFFHAHTHKLPIMFTCSCSHS
jgi:hypothetical protein